MRARPAANPGIAAGNASADRIYREAAQAWKSRRFKTILPKIERALRKSRDHRLWYLHGLMMRSLERYEQSVRSLRKSVELNPWTAEPAFALARTLYEAGLPSVREHVAALKLAPGDDKIVESMAFALVAEGRLDDAVTGLARIVSKSPLWLPGHIVLAKLRWAQGEREGFTRSFDEALKAHPQAMDLRRDQVIALMHAEQWDEVVDRIEQGRAAVGEQPVFAVHEALILAHRGQSERADALIAQLSDTADASVQVRRVRHFLRNGRPELAAEVIDSWLCRREGFMFWPYAAIVWRMIDQPRWEWLEGHESFVGVYDIADRLPPLDELADTLRRLHTMTGQPLDQSLRGGTQTDGDIFTRIEPILVRLRETVRSAVARHVSKFPPRDERHPLLGPPRNSIRFAGAWSSRLQGGGFHANHFHPAGWISSALYIALPPDLGREEAGYLTLGDPSGPHFELDLPPFKTIEPKPGRLVLFPSYTFHGTKPFGEGERLTVAFDVARPH